ncbi:MAG: PAS domain-containing protein [Capsulimonadaceae bacterium]|nr:PAS domain-containing protein [Capsulimonadaceae bacterium]
MTGERENESQASVNAANRNTPRSSTPACASYVFVVDRTLRLVHSTLPAYFSHATPDVHLSQVLQRVYGPDLACAVEAAVGVHMAGPPSIEQNGVVHGYRFTVRSTPSTSGAASVIVIAITDPPANNAQSIGASCLQPFYVLADQMPQLVWIADANSRLTYLNEKCAEFTGCSTEEIMRREWSLHAFSEDSPRIVNVRKEHVERREAYELEFRLRRRDGVYRWFVSRAQPMYEPSGAFVGWIGTCTDIDDSKRMKEAQRFLWELSDKLRHTSDEAELQQDVVSALGHFLEAARCGYCAIEIENDRTIVLRDYCNGVASMRGAHVRHEFGTFVDELAAGRTVVLEDCETDPRTRVYYHKVHGPLGINAAIYVPIMREGKHVASLFVHHAHGPRKWASSEIDLVSTVAERTWLTFENARLHKQTKEMEARQRLFMVEVMRSVTGGKLTVCLTGNELPQPSSEPVAVQTVDRSTGLKDLRDLSRSLARKMLFPTPRVHDLVTGVAEAAMNAIVHAGAGLVTVHAWESTIQVRIEDTGAGISDDLLPRATLERGYTTAASLGHGFKMMLETIDRIWLLTGPMGTTVVLEQYALSPTSAMISLL